MNRALILGSSLLLILLCLAVIGPGLAPYAVDYEEKVYLDRSGQEDRYIIAPEPPSARHPFGSDPWGYDILTILLYGARYTIFLCLGASALRILVALACVWFWFPRAPLKMTHATRSISALPVFLFVYFIFFGINYNPPLSAQMMALLQGGIIALIGVPHAFSHFAELTAATRENEFVEAAVISGATHTRILFKHILPQIWERIVIVFCQESIAILNLIGQLGIFNIFIGGTRTTPYPLMFHSRSHEWAGLVGTYRGKILSTEWWTLGFPLAGFSVLLFSLYIFTRGLERYFSQRYRRVG